MKKNNFGFCNFSSHSKNCLSWKLDIKKQNKEFTEEEKLFLEASKTLKQVNLIEVRTDLDEKRMICNSCKDEFFHDFDFAFFDKKEQEIKEKLEQNRLKLQLNKSLPLVKKEPKLLTSYQERQLKYKAMIFEAINNNYCTVRDILNFVENKFKVFFGMPGLYKRCELLVFYGELGKKREGKNLFYFIKEMEG